MGHSHSRGQSTAELLIVMLVLSAIVLTYVEYSEIAAQLFRNVQLSGETR